MSSGTSDAAFDARLEAYRAAERERESIRKKNGVALVSEAQDGTGLHRLPQGVYGFTYAPAMSDSPLFRKSGSRTFEVHKCGGNEFLIGYLTAADAARLNGRDTIDLLVYPAPEGASSVLAEVPLSRVTDHKTKSYREIGALELRVVGVE